MIGWPDAGQVPDAGAARCWAHSARGLPGQGAFFKFYLFQFYKVAFSHFLFNSYYLLYTFSHFLFIFSHFFINKVAEVLATFLVRNKLASATEAFQPVGVVDRIPLGGFPMAPPANNPTAGIGIKPAGLMPPPPPPV